MSGQRESGAGGGGLDFSDARLTLIGCEISGNRILASPATSAYGGGVSVAGEVEITNPALCASSAEVYALLGLMASASGGGPFLSGSGSISTAVIRANQVLANGDPFGGQIHELNGNASVTDCYVELLVSLPCGTRCSGLRALAVPDLARRQPGACGNRVSLAAGLSLIAGLPSSSGSRARASPSDGPPPTRSRQRAPGRKWNRS